MPDQQLDLNDYKRRIVDLYNRRSINYDHGKWRLQICHRLLEYSQISYQQHILDIGTGTGHLAIASAEIVGVGGRVVGVDISPQMLDVARSKVKALSLSNVELQLADAEAINYPANSFDRILCANTFPWIEDKQAALRTWYKFLKPGGLIAIHTPANTAYVGQVVLRSVLKRYGIKLDHSNRIGSIESCKQLFVNAGFEGIDIKTEQYGSYVSFDSVKAKWEELISFSFHSKSEEILSQLALIPLAEAKAKFEMELETLQTKKGIWDDLTTLYILGHKAEINKPV
ncbi:class I SAM-dependent methyltransferase [Calothrix rhizosoleniae]|uniref:class I SAM-dependent methyltransferase n=1 Tax=Calothrix rhizosoleniae TaxID=888997 RepID=UPI000B49CEDE|nr:methyltransferase domain-containing protein [Calothrix rhizosoleniae]